MVSPATRTSRKPIRRGLTMRRQGFVHAAYHQFHIVDRGCAAELRPGPTNGLISVTGPGAAIAHTGTHTGPVNVTLESLPDRPTNLELSTWDEVVEVSIFAPAGEL